MQRTIRAAALIRWRPPARSHCCSSRDHRRADDRQRGRRSEQAISVRVEDPRARWSRRPASCWAAGRSSRTASPRQLQRPERRRSARARDGGNWNGTWSASFQRLLPDRDRRSRVSPAPAPILAFWVNNARPRWGSAPTIQSPATACCFSRLLRQELPEERRRARRQGAGDRGLGASLQRLGHRLQRRQGHAEQGGRGDGHAAGRRPRPRRTAPPSCRSPGPGASR